MGMTLTARPASAAATLIDPEPRPIAVVLDGTPSAAAALECAVDLARTRDCALTLLVAPRPARRVQVLWALGTAVMMSTTGGQAAGARRILAESRRAVPPDVRVADAIELAGGARRALRQVLSDERHQLVVVGRGVGRYVATLWLPRRLGPLTPVLVVSCGRGR